MEKTDPISPKRTRDPDSKRAALHEAALREFTERGYEDVSMASIAKTAGIAVGTIYRFYENKLTLLRTMLEDIEGKFVDQMQSDWQQGGPYGDRLDRICHGLFRVSDENRGPLGLLTMTTDVVFEDGSLPGDRIQAHIKAMYLDAAKDGAFREGDADLMAAMAHGLVEGAMMRWMRLGSPKELDAAGQLAAVLKHGFLAREGASRS